MPDTINPLLDEAIRRQVVLERLKSGQVRDFNTIFKDIAAEVRSKAAGIDVTGATRKAFDDWLGTMEKSVHSIYTKQLKLLTPELEKISGVYAALEAGDITKATLGKATMKLVTPRQAFGYAKKLPMAFSGETLETFVGKLAGNETARVVGTFRKGYYQGKTNTQLVKEVIGSKARNYKDGILDVSRRNASTVVRTSVQHVASAGRSKVWENNKDIIDQYEWVSTLDGKTSNQCKSLDGQKWDIGKGPTPPIHPNCRSTTVAVLADEFKFLSEGRTRSSKDGYVSADENYYDWLKKQDAAFQDTALGKTRGKLFRDGGLSAEQFRDLNLGKDFKPLSLAEMKVAEPEAFKKAFGSGPAVKPPVAPVANNLGALRAKREAVAELGGEKALQKIKDLEEEVRASGLASMDARGVNESAGEYMGRTNASREKWFAGKEKLRDLQDGAIGRAHNLIALPDGERSPFGKIILNPKDSGSRVNQIKAGGDFVGSLAKADRLPKVSVVVDADLPGGVALREHYLDKRIHIDKHTRTQTVVHEIVHDLEYRFPWIAKKTDAFRAKRAGFESPRALNEIYPSDGYDFTEFTFEDDWHKRGGTAYTGKIYRVGDAATEVLTTGVERMFADPIKFAIQDPEFFDFIMEVLQGEI